MSDMGELFRDIKEEKQRKRRKNYKSNTEKYGNDPSWTKHTELHWSKRITIEGKEVLVNYWPSSNKWQVGGHMYRGSLPKHLRELIHGI